MPELLPTYERLVELAGGGDIAARFLTLYRPPAYMRGCSQAVWTGPPPLLVRNYDYSPQLFEGTVLHTAWNGRTVIGTGDCLWGLVDGMNEDGLAVSLSFGGRREVGEGFGVPLLLRYILEFCSTTKESVEVLCRVPTHMSYNVTVLDRQGDYKTVFIAPDRKPQVRDLAMTTNHQQGVEWHQHARASATLERERALRTLPRKIRGRFLPTDSCVSAPATALHRLPARIRDALHRGIPSTVAGSGVPVAT